MASKVFITATDTDAGKTWVTASAVRSLLSQNEIVRALKPVACGLNNAGQNEDIQVLLSAQDLQNPNNICLYRFEKPAAPSQAGDAEGKQVDPHELVGWCEEKSSDVEITLIEGVGGLMVPITYNWLVSDWIQAMPDAEVWLVVGCKLGAINQTLLSLDKLKQMGRAPTRIFFNATKPEQNDWVASTRKAVEPFLNQASCTIHCLKFGEPANLIA